MAESNIISVTYPENINMQTDEVEIDLYDTISNFLCNFSIDKGLDNSYFDVIHNNHTVNVDMTFEEAGIFGKAENIILVKKNNPA